VGFFVAIHGFHLFEIRVYARRGVVLSLTLALVAASAAAIIMVLGTLVPGLATPWGFTVTCLVAGLLLRPAVRHLTALTDTLFFPERVAVQKLTREVLPEVASHTDVRDLARALSTTVVDSLGLSSAALYVVNEEGAAFNLAGSAGPRPVDARTITAPSWEPREIRQFEAVIAVRFRERVIGLLGLGSKTAGELIAPEEIKELELATVQVAAMVENARLFALATRDSLTGLFRRSVFDERLAMEASRFARGGRSCAVVLIDIDHFKKVNDTWGHQRGDDVLASVADVIGKSCRDIDTVARYGGEEIVVLLPEADEAGALAVGEKLRAAVEALAPPRVPAPVTVSAGVAVLAAGMRPQELVGQADEALYRAKHGGRNRVELSWPFPRLATLS
jgi:diguanylate cyclase (GGDEF)-like protein